ncbi:hypothetical protein MMC34_002223 [Xylographa carneopallida]|nr:hypothetical protein [Xylographa carneopallida]
MDAVGLAAFLDVARMVARQSKITENAAIIVCLVVMLAMISLLMVVLWWLRIIIFLGLFFRITQMFPAPSVRRLQTSLPLHETSRAQLQHGQIVEVVDSGAGEIPAGHEDTLIARLRSEAS